MSITTERPVTTFQDWHQLSRTDHNLSGVDNRRDSTTMTSETLGEAYLALLNPDTSNATSIMWQKISAAERCLQPTRRQSKRTQFMCLDLMNQGAYNGPRLNKRYDTYRINEWAVRSIASQMDLLTRQSDMASTYLHSLDLSDWGLKAELVTFSLCTYILHADEGDCRLAHPACANRDDRCCTVQESLRLTDKEVISMYNKIQYHFDRSSQALPPQFDTYDMDGGYCIERVGGKTIRGVVAGQPVYEANGEDTSAISNDWGGWDSDMEAGWDDQETRDWAESPI